MASIHRGSLKLVARRGIAMLQMGVVPRIDLLHPSPVEKNFDLSVPDLLDRSKIPVQDILIPVVPEKQNPVSSGKLPLPVGGCDADSCGLDQPLFLCMTAGPVIDVPGFRPGRGNRHGRLSLQEIQADRLPDPFLRSEP